MTKRKYLLLALVSISGLAFAGSQFAKSPDPKFGADPVEASHLVIAETSLLVPADRASMTRTFSGLIKAARTSELGFKRAGRVEEILVQAGQLVEAGQVLARLDVQQTQADLEQSRASLQAAEAQLSEALAGPRSEAIAAAQAQVADSDSDVKLWTARFNRFQELNLTGAISAQEFDDSRFQLEAATSRREKFRRQLEELQVGTRPEQIALFRARVAQNEATLRRLEIELEDCYLRAPYAGQVSTRQVDEGAVVGPGTTIFRLVEQKEIEAWVGLPTEYIPRLSATEKQAVDVEGRSYSATLRDILPEVDLATRTQTVVFRLSSDSASEELPFPGQMFRLTLTRDETPDGFWVPITAISRGQRGLWSVTIVSPDDHKLERRDVEVLHVDSNRVLIRGLIESGERYVTTGLHRLTPGQRVNITAQGDTP
ncbi:MAG: efflux RND transporter periplasmic adaptor subunit [Planctomycetaceae bacterium]|nr:efflux RND transporter periplasmic adaptor subunit [Planctomycetaceae bacterium]